MKRSKSFGFQSLARRTGQVQALRCHLNFEIGKASHGKRGPRAKHQGYLVQGGERGKPGRTGTLQGTRQCLGNSKNLLRNLAFDPQKYIK